MLTPFPFDINIYFKYTYHNKKIKYVKRKYHHISRRTFTMTDNTMVQLSHLIDTSTHRAIVAEVKKIFSFHYPVKYFSAVNRSYGLVKNLYEGKFPNYKACNTEYHNLSHTLDAMLAAVRLIDGHNMERSLFPVHLTVNLLNAALLHDAGYIQEDSEHEGTGAKYTTFHVERSVQFLRNNHGVFKIYPDDITIIDNLIRCTGIMVKIEAIPFSTSEEKIAGCILGTADLLGQMSDRAYLEKLIFLYYEFKEAGIKGFDTEFELVRKTIDFYEFTKKRLAESYSDTYSFARSHFRERFAIDHNLYMEAIDRNIGYLHKIIEDGTTNFRHKLKRGRWVHTYQGTKSSS